MRTPFLHTELRYKPLEDGRFQCPTCDEEKDYTLRQCRRVLVVGRLLLAPLEELGVDVVCNGCGKSFPKEVLQRHPEAEDQKWQSEYTAAAMDAWLEICLADGGITPNEQATLLASARIELRRDLDPDKVLQRAHFLRETPSIHGYHLDRCLGRMSDVGRESILRGAWKICHADGEPNKATLDAFGDLAVRLRISDAHLRGVLAEVGEGE